ncbi:MAG: hypothetical protein JNK14_08645 [Chitinophagaceae bacterium]|nr:hypothetical protein [Chitinophagaceae bacterium]
MKVRLVKFPVLFLMVLMIVYKLPAQSRSADTAKSKPAFSNSYAQAGVNYISNTVFAGRKDSVAVPYLSPSISYSHKSGVFAKGSLSYLTSAKESRIDLYTLTAGYVYSKNNFIAGVDATKYFFNSSSTNVRSGMSGYAALFTGYNFKDIFTTYVDGMVIFGPASDFILGLELNHPFYAAHDRLKITPTIYTNFGTQNYYNEYYSTKRSGSGGGGGYGNGNGGPGGSGSTETTTLSVVESAKFQLLDYEFSLPVSYTYKQLTVFCTPVLAIPVHPSLITSGGQTTREELSNTFFWSAGIGYKFTGK